MNKRQIRLLNYLYASKQFITSRTLSNYLSVSDRTIKSDISVINDSLPDDIKIKSKKSKGYILDVKGDDRIDAFVSTLDAQAAKNITVFPDEDRFLYMAQLLYWKDGYTTISKLEEELYLSRTVILSLLTSIAKAAKMHRIYLYSSKKYGIKLSGEEFYARQFISSIYEACKYKASYSNFPKSSSFFNIEIYNDIRRILIEILREHRYRVYDFGVSKIICYLCVSLESIRNNNIIDYDITDVEKLPIDEIKLAIDIYKRLQIPYSKKLENEYQALGVYLLEAHEFLPDELDLTQYSYYSNQLDYVSDICRTNNRFLDIALKDFNTNQKFHSLLLHIIIDINLPSLQSSILSSQNYPHANRSPLSDGIAANIILTIENLFNTKLASNLIKLLSQLFFSNLLVTPSSIDMKILVSSIYGVNFTTSFVQQINRLAGIYFSKIEICSSYELKYMDLSQYGAIILHHILKIDTPKNTEVKYINTEMTDFTLYQTINDLYNQRIIRTFLDKISKVTIESQNIISNNQLVELLTNRFNVIESNVIQNAIIIHLNRIFSKILFIFFDNELTTQKNQLYIIKNSSKKMEYDEIFCLSFDLRGKIDNLRLVHTLSYLYIHDSNILKPYLDQ